MCEIHVLSVLLKPISFLFFLISLFVVCSEQLMSKVINVTVSTLTHSLCQSLL